MWLPGTSDPDESNLNGIFYIHVNHTPLFITLPWWQPRWIQTKKSNPEVMWDRLSYAVHLVYSSSVNIHGGPIADSLGVCPCIERLKPHCHKGDGWRAGKWKGSAAPCSIFTSWVKGYRAAQPVVVVWGHTTNTLPWHQWSGTLNWCLEASLHDTS